LRQVTYWRWRASSSSHDAAEPDMRSGGVHRLRITGGGTVALAIVRSAQVRASLEHLAPDLDLGGAGIPARPLVAAARIAGRAATRTLGGPRLGVPVGGPLPGVADHVVEA